MAYTLPEALWLASTGVCDDILVGYPTVHGAALRALATDPAAAAAITMMVDSVAHLDFLAAALGNRHPPIRLCLELDASWRRGAAVAAVREHADLEFVNGGGTGSLAATAADPAVTEVTAGSGLYGPTLFDAYRAWRPEPAAFFALPVVRRPGPGVATVLGGGWIASGQTSRIRQPTPWLPPGLKLTG